MPSGGQHPVSAVMTHHPDTPDGSWLETCTVPGSDKAERTAWYGVR